MKRLLFLITLFVTFISNAQFDQNVHITTVDKSTIGVGNQTYNLPALGITYDDVQILVKNSGAGTFTIDGFNTETIDEQLTIVLDNDNDFVFLIKDESNSNNWTIVSQSSTGGGGGPSFVPQIIQRNKTGTANFPTVLTTVDFDNSQIDDGFLSYSAGEFTVLAGADGKRLRVDWSIGGDGATNRVQLASQLQINTGTGFTTVKESSNYTARNNTQSRGGISGFFYIDSVSTGDIIRIQIIKTGSAANNLALETSITFETKN